MRALGILGAALAVTAPFLATAGAGDAPAPIAPPAPTTATAPASAAKDPTAAKDSAGTPAAAPAAAKDAAGADGPPADELPERLRLPGRDPEEDAVAREWSRAIQALEREAVGFQGEVRLLLRQRYDARKARITADYDREIDRLEVEEDRERADAIAALERFLARHPAHPRYTPDALLRLAELYYEKSKNDAADAMIAHEAALRAIADDEHAAVPEPPRADYGRSIALYRRLLTEFPAAPNQDAARYLLAYCLELGEEAEASRAAYLELIERHPDSKFVPEAWVRLGEYYFDAPGGDPLENLRLAADAYGRMLAYPDHALFDKALYKLAWTYYRLDDYDRGVGSFVQLVDHYASRKDGEEGGAGDLREEALQYTALSFVDEAWGGLPKAVAYFRSLGGRPWEGEIYRRMGDILWELQRKDDAGRPASVEAYRLFLRQDPLHADAPEVQARIVAAFARERLFPDEARERDLLVENYREGGAWFERHRDDPEATGKARELIQQAVRVVATYHHAQAQQHKAEGRLAEAHQSYATAARAYGEYLRLHPNAKDVYELTYFQAECLYESADFAGAALAYERVRDFEGEEKYRADAGFGAVHAYQKAMEREAAAGRLPMPKALTSKERGEGVPVNPRPLPGPMARFVAAADLYAERFPPDENSPAIAFKAAELFYAHDDFPEARRRFEAVIVAFPKDPVAQSAANLIVETYLVAKDWVNVQDAIGKLLARTDLELAPELRGSLTTFKLGSIFQQANLLMEEGKHEEAAAEFLRLVQEKPDHEFADKALNNAAVCFENAQRFDSAMKTYERIIAEYPRSSFADAALFRVAENARKSYDFDKAVTKYEQLVRDYPDSKERANALNNLAVLLVGLQRYDEGARAYQRFAQLFPDDADAARNAYRAAVVYERERDWPKLVSALEAFIRRFGDDAKQKELVVQARLKIARAQSKRGNERAARVAYEACTEEFDRRYGSGGTAEPAAQAAAAECAFRLAEYGFAAWDQLRIEGSRKALEASFRRKKDAVPELKDRYLEVARYKNVDWTLAAFYRKAYVLERLANAFFEAPVPPEVKRLGPEAEDLYRGKIAEVVIALEDGAVKDFEETLEQARRFGIANEWTRRTLESLNRFRPKEYPILKEARVRLQPDGALPVGLATLPTGFARLEGTGPAPAKAGTVSGGKLGPAPATSFGPTPAARPAVGPAPVPASGIGAGGARAVAPAGKVGGKDK